MDQHLSVKAFAQELTRLEQLDGRRATSISGQSISRSISRIPGAEDRGPGTRPRYRVTRAAIPWVREHMRCSRPGCDELAPGPSGRCGLHRAKVLSEPQRRSCERCGEDLDLVHGSRIKLGRGKFCRLCWPVVRDERLVATARTANPDGSRAFHADVERQVDELAPDWIRPGQAAGMLGISAAWLAYGYHCGGRLRGTVHHFGGSPRLLFRAAEVEEFRVRWARGERPCPECGRWRDIPSRRRERRRARRRRLGKRCPGCTKRRRWEKDEEFRARWRHRRWRSMAGFGAIGGKRSRRPTTLSDHQVERAWELYGTGDSIRSIANKLEIPKGRVERLFASG